MDASEYEDQKMALQLQLSDIEATLQLLNEDFDALKPTERERSNMKRKRADSEVTDREVALMSLESEIQRQEDLIENIELALKVNFAIDLTGEDEPTTGLTLVGKRGKRATRRTTSSYAKVISLLDPDGEATSSDKRKSTGPEIIDLTGDDEHYDTTKRSSRELRPRPKVSCSACLEMFRPTETFKGKCDHAFCRDCLKSMFLMAMRDEELYPPRCCGKPVKPNRLSQILTSGEIKTYEEKTVEYTAKDRLYCASPPCSKFIPKSAIRDEHGTCPACKLKTHKLCRSLAHPNIDCPMDKALQAVLKVAQKQKWKRCPSCKAMVSLANGCAHITCRCGHHFCYECGVAWKSCRCPTWPEGYRQRRA